MPTRLLVIDDSPTIRKLVEISFRSSAYSIQFASTGAEGVALAKRVAPALILLDFVLPDMRGPDVCAELAGDHETARIPIILLTAKGADARRLVADYPAVVDCLLKPFSREGIVQAVQTALGGRPERAAHKRAPLTGFSRTQRQSAANALYQRMRNPLAQIPAWMKGIGSSTPATYFARKILTPDLVDDLLEVLGPVYREVIETNACAGVPDRSEGGLFTGHVESWPIADVVAFFGSSGRSGELTVTVAGKTFIAYFNAGELILVTNREPDDYVRGAFVDLHEAREDALESARAEQRRSGKPLYVSLAEAGTLPNGDLEVTLHACSKRLVLELLAAQRGHFRWHDLTAFPSYVSTYGRHVSLSRATLLFGPPPGEATPASTLSQLTLERLRNEHETTDAQPVCHDDSVFERARGFSRRVSGLQLNALERLVLTLVDGNARVVDVGARGGLAARDVALVLDRLATVGLVSPRATDDARVEDASGRAAHRPVLIFEPDSDGFQRPLESLLKSRPVPIELVAVGGAGELCAAAQREHPRLVIVNADAAGAEIDDAARAIRGATDLADVSLVAILESRAEERVDELSAAGFNAVLVKPILFSDLEKLLA